jgi:abortive infection bacteriophage resistance protein
VYYVSNKYKSSPTWFIDPKVISHSFIYEIEYHYNDAFIKNNKTIKLHHKNNIDDKYAPKWKTLEFFTFGTILKIYKLLVDDEIKERISNEYGIRNLNNFVNLIETIVYVRNTCAHGGVLFDLQTPKGISILPCLNFNDNNRHSLDSSIKIILFILNKISNGRMNDLEKTIGELFIEHKENLIIKNIIENKIGFQYYKCVQ